MSSDARCNGPGRSPRHRSHGEKAEHVVVALCEPCERAARGLLGQLGPVKGEVAVPQGLPSTLSPASRMRMVCTAPSFSPGGEVNHGHPAPVLSSTSMRGGSKVTRPWHHVGFRLGLVFLGLFGIAFAIAGLLVGLPRPAVGETCGPSTSSESAIVAFFDPGSIGAGAEPAATNATNRADWLAFVGECQASADGRVLGTFALLILSIGVAAVGTALVLGANRKPGGTNPQLASSAPASRADRVRSGWIRVSLPSGGVGTGRLSTTAADP